MMSNSALAGQRSGICSGKLSVEERRSVCLRRERLAEGIRRDVSEEQFNK